jgi:hypothetical protein
MDAIYLPEVSGVRLLPGIVCLSRCGEKLTEDQFMTSSGMSLNQRFVHGEQTAAQRGKGESPAVLQERGVPSTRQEASDRFAYTLRGHCTKKVRLAADTRTAG